MRIGVLGINFKTADISIRELVSKACQKKISYISKLAEKYSCVVLSTCNRTEIYFSADNLAEAHSELLNILREEIHIAFEHKLYSYFGVDCFLHLAQVTSGLDSAILAESEIQRQVKIAYEQALLYHSLPSSMHFLFQKCLKLGKEIRSKFCLSQNEVTIAKILFEIGQQVFKDLSHTPLLFVGNSEINRKIIAYFKRKGIQSITLCTRSKNAAIGISEKEGLKLLSWDLLSTWKDFPLVICASNAPHYIVNFPNEGMKARLIFDLGVPRNVDPNLTRHPNLTLLNMEEIGSIIEMRQKKNLIEINRAEVIIFEGVQRYLNAFQKKDKRVFVCA